MPNITKLPPKLPRQSDAEVVEKNRAEICKAMSAIYATRIYDCDNAAKHRGEAIRALNKMCYALEMPDLVAVD